MGKNPVLNQWCLHWISKAQELWRNGLSWFPDFSSSPVSQHCLWMLSLDIPSPFHHLDLNSTWLLVGTMKRLEGEEIMHCKGLSITHIPNCMTLICLVCPSFICSSFSCPVLLKTPRLPWVLYPRISFNFSAHYLVPQALGGWLHYLVPKSPKTMVILLRSQKASVTEWDLNTSLAGFKVWTFILHPEGRKWLSVLDWTVVAALGPDKG